MGIAYGLIVCVCEIVIFGETDSFMNLGALLTIYLASQTLVSQCYLFDGYAQLHI